METVVVGECEALLRNGEYVAALLVLQRGTASATGAFKIDLILRYLRDCAHLHGYEMIADFRLRL